MLLTNIADRGVRERMERSGVQVVPIRGKGGKAGGIEFSLFRPGADAVVLRAPRDFTRTDWRGFGTLVVDIENRDFDEVKVSVTLKGRYGEADMWKYAVFTALVPARGRAGWRIPLRQLRYSSPWGSPWGIPRQKGLGSLEASGLLDTMSVREIRISFIAPPHSGRLGLPPAGVDDPKFVTTARLGLYGLRLENPVKPEGWIDRYGQNTAFRFAGKAKSDADLVRADRREAAELARTRPFPERDRFQAWTGALARKATGFFRVEAVNGCWWLVAPNGRLYFATGMDVVGCGVDARLDRAVLAAHSWLPPRTGLMAEAWSRWGLSLYRANLIRKWGEGYKLGWLTRAIDRQRAWGFTSIGNWSDRRLFGLRMLPYFSVGPSHEGIRTKYAAKLIHDAFDPKFEGEARSAASTLKETASDRWLVGHFISNEVGWNEFPAHVLELPPDRPAKRELLGRLRRRYGNIRRLNRAWGSSAPSFAELRWPPDPVRTPAAERDMADFRGDFADRWYGAWARAIRAADPNHILLGSRLNQGARPPEVIAACARHNDVVSFNHYDIEAWRGEFDRYYALARKPFFIGEYGHNSMDTGLLTAAVPVRDQRARAVGYRLYTEGMAAMPYFVGGHFFQYLDEPITGRGDRETAFNGFVNVADIPYPMMVRAAKASHARVYGVHAGELEPFRERPEL